MATNPIGRPVIKYKMLLSEKTSPVNYLQNQMTMMRKELFIALLLVGAIVAASGDYCRFEMDLFYTAERATGFRQSQKNILMYL